MPTILPETTAKTEMLAQLVKAETDQMKEFHDREIAESLAEFRGDLIFEILRAIHTGSNGLDLAATIVSVIDCHVVDRGIFERETL